MTDRERQQRGQITAALRVAPLDRVRLMKTLFLFWYRSGKPEAAPFHFQPYLYGPCAFNLYAALEAMEREGLIVRAPHSIERWADYHLTEAGDTAAPEYEINDRANKSIAEIARWARSRSFRALLREVYREAPEFARGSVFQG